MKRLIIAIRNHDGFSGVTVLPVIFKMKNIDNYLKMYPELTNSLSLRMMLGDGGSDYIAENFKNVEFTMLKLQFHSKLHVLSCDNVKHYEASHCLFYDMLTDSYEILELPTDYED